MFKLNYDGSVETRSFKDTFSQTIEKLIQEDSRVVYLDADLMNSFGTSSLPGKYPDQAIDCGIQEANMVGVASGMAAEGKIPYCHTFGVFASRRCFDQMFLSAGYAGNSIRMLGSDPGICAMYNGGTHMPFEDVALYRTIPGAAIFDPCDSVQFQAVLEGIKERPGVTYIRSQRKNAVKVYDQFDYQCGKANVLIQGTDVAIFASGIMVAEALKAAQILKTQSISASVIDLVTVKPLDEPCIIQQAQICHAAVTCENSNIRGGVFGAVCECLSAQSPIPVEAVGIYDEYGEVGTYEYLKERFHLTADEIAEKAKLAILRKTV